MIKRITQKWTFTRVLFAVLGFTLIIQSSMRFEWLGVFIGLYFAAMGIFAFGCARGNCYGGNCEIKEK